MKRRFWESVVVGLCSIGVVSGSSGGAINARQHVTCYTSE